MCQTKPFCSVLFVSLQKQSAKEIAWPIMQRLQRQYGWRGKFNAFELSFTFEGTGGRIRLVGADSEHFARLYRGSEHDLVIIDEAQEFAAIDLHQLIFEIFMPTLDDRRGRLFMMGTPPRKRSMMKGFFFDVVVRRLYSDWVVVHGQAFENPHNKEQIEEREASLKAANPDVENEAWFQRERRAIWVVDANDLVLNLTGDNFITDHEPWGSDEYTLGVHWAADGPSAYTLASWNSNKDNKIVLFEAFERDDMGFFDHLEVIDSDAYEAATGKKAAGKGYVQRYPGIRVVADMQKKESHATLQDSYGVYVERVEIKDDIFATQRLQGDVDHGHLQLYNLDSPSKPDDHTLCEYYGEFGWETKGDSFESNDALHRSVLLARQGSSPELYEPPVEETKTQDQIIYEKKLAAHLGRRPQPRRRSRSREAFPW